MNFADVLSWVANLIQVGSPLAVLALMLRERREVKILARNATSGEQKQVAWIPARFVSRAEILGIVAQAAGGGRLDFSSFRFDHHFGSEVLVDLPEESFKLLR